MWRWYNFLFFSSFLFSFFNCFCFAFEFVAKVYWCLKTFQAFFLRWWRQQSEAMKVKVMELVNSGQLEFMYDFH